MKRFLQEHGKLVVSYTTEENLPTTPAAANCLHILEDKRVCMTHLIKYLCVRVLCLTYM